MLKFFVSRVLSAIPVAGVVTAVVFALTYLSPADPAAILAGDYASPAQIAAVRERLHLDAPIISQYIHWVGGVLTGDLGVSIFSGRPVSTLIIAGTQPTIILALLATVFALMIAVPLGLLAAQKQRTIIDKIVSLFCVAGTSLPAFLIGYALVFVFGVYFGMLPVAGFSGLDQGISEIARHALLPAITLGFAQTALLTRITRASTLEVLSQDFIRVARAKGVDERTILTRHCLRLIGVPLLTVVGTLFAYMLGGVVITETVFAIPGIGRLLVDAIQHKDIPVIQGVLLVTSMLYVLINLVVDLAYLIVDPRITYN